jgi:hypothetical protein
MFQLFKNSGGGTNADWLRRWSPAGVVLSRGAGHGGVPLQDPMLGGFLTQLSDDGLSVETDDGYVLGWDALYAAMSQPAYAALPEVFSLPQATEARPLLRSSNSLTDNDFAVAISGWHGEDGTAFDWELMGPLMSRDDRTELMRPEQWSLFKEVVNFARRPAEEHNDLAHRQAWGRIRKLALEAGAGLDDFLYRSVVLTPEKLEISLRRSADIADDRVVEIEPGFEGAPADWLEAFDRSREVRNRYDIVTKEGIV